MRTRPTIFLTALLVTVSASLCSNLGFADQLRLVRAGDSPELTVEPKGDPYLAEYFRFQVAPRGNRVSPLFDRAVTAAFESNGASPLNRRTLYRWLNVSEIEVNVARFIVRSAMSDGTLVMSNEQIAAAINILHVQAADWLKVRGTAMLGTLCRLWQIDSMLRQRGSQPIYSFETWVSLFQQLRERINELHPDSGDARHAVLEWFIPVRFGQSNSNLATQTLNFLMVTRPGFYARAEKLVRIYPFIDPLRQIELAGLLKRQIVDALVHDDTFPNEKQALDMAKNLVEFYLGHSTPDEKAHFLEAFVLRLIKETDRHQSPDVRTFADEMVAMIRPVLKNTEKSEAIESLRRKLQKEALSGYSTAKSQLRIYDPLRSELHSGESADKSEIKTYRRYVEGWLELPYTMTDAKTSSYLQTYLSLMKPSDAVHAATAWIRRILSEHSKNYVMGSFSAQERFETSIELDKIMAALLQFACDHAANRQQVILEILKPYMNSEWFGFAPEFEKVLMKNIATGFDPARKATDSNLVSSTEMLLNEIVITRPSMKSLVYLRIFFDEIKPIINGNTQLGMLFRTVYEKNAVVELHHAITEFEARTPKNDLDSVEKNHQSREQAAWIKEQAAFCTELLFDVKSQFFALTPENFQKQYRNFLVQIASFGSTAWSSINGFEQTMWERQKEHVPVNSFYETLLDELHPKLAAPAVVPKIRLVYSANKSSCARDLAGNP